jgi:hypothetical protein
VQNYSFLGSTRNGFPKINRIPENNGRYDKVETGRTVALVLEWTVANLAKAVEEDGASQRIASFTLIETGLHTGSQGRVLHPVQDE